MLDSGHVRFLNPEPAPQLALFNVTLELREDISMQLGPVSDRST